ncbi:hypothetical protein TNCV_3017181 [Trichonephila clavipes]|nr:hypothetical protein TNCV_3017181 [Trichonephila clavipes]
MSLCALHKIIQKFEITGQSGILPSRRRKQILSSSIENVAIGVVEASNQSSDSSVNQWFPVYRICRTLLCNKFNGGDVDFFSRSKNRTN